MICRSVPGMDTRRKGEDQCRNTAVAYTTTQQQQQPINQKILN